MIKRLFRMIPLSISFLRPNLFLRSQHSSFSLRGCEVLHHLKSQTLNKPPARATKMPADSRLPTMMATP